MDSIFLLVLYEVVIIYIYILSVIMEAFRSVIIEAFRDQFTATELLSYKEVLYDEATVYAQRDPGEVDHEECNCMRLAQQFCHLMKEYRE